MKLDTWDSIWIALAIISFTALVLPVYIRNANLRKWRKKLWLDKHKTTYKQLYFQINGFEVSNQARQHHDDLALTYGEIQFEPFVALLSLCKPDETTIFYDLGSGIGKAVIAAAMVFPIKQAIGVECIDTLHNTAQQIKKNLINQSYYALKKKVIHFVHQDFLEYNWQDGNLIFINSTAIIGNLWVQLLEKLENLQINTIVITTTKSIPKDSFELIYCTDVLMSWGIVTAYIHRKIE